MVVFTAGYEAQNIDDFARQLKKRGITLLVDVRELPLSRKRGFSKSSLSHYMESLDIGYMHLKALGSPREVRQELKDTGDYLRFFRQYRTYLDQQEETLELLSEVVAHEIVCLMCYEKDPNRCHRSIIAEELSDRGDVEVCHL